jgi:hypothetical protein
MSTKKATSNDVGTSQEHYEFAAIPSEGKINVENHAHGAENVAGHTHTVSIDEQRARNPLHLSHRQISRGGAANTGRRSRSVTV